MAEKRYFSLPAAARELGVSTDVLRHQYRRGLIPAIKTPGGQPRFTTETIDTIKQAGWPQALHSENKIESIQRPAPQLPQEVSEDQFPDSLECARIDQEELDFRTMRTEKAPVCRESEERRKQRDLFHFHQKWIDDTCRLLPYWLTPEQVAEVSRQIEIEIKERTPEDEPWMPSLCEKIVHSAVLPLKRHCEMTQVRTAALNQVLAKIPCDVTDSEKTRVQALARSAIQQAGEQFDRETLFDAAWHAVTPVLAAVDLRRQRERLRSWALQKLPCQANEKEQREGKAAINNVIEQMKGQPGEAVVRDNLEEALEPILAAIPRRIEEEHRRQRVTGLLSSAKLHVGTYLHTLYNQAELDYEAICDWEWRQRLERIVVAELQEQLSGDETSEELRELVEDILEDQLKETDDEE